MSRPTGLILALCGGLALLANPVQVHAQSLPSISGLQLHFDADDPLTIFDGGGVNPGGAGFDASNIVQWNDKSPNGTHMTLIDPAEQAVTTPGYAAGVQNGRPTVRFADRDALGNADVTGSNLPTSQARSIFAALTPTDAINSQNWYFSYGQPGDREWNALMLIDSGLPDTSADGIYDNFFVGAGTAEFWSTDGDFDLNNPPASPTIIEFGYDGNITYDFHIDGTLDRMGPSNSMGQTEPLATDLTSGARLGIGVHAGGANQANFDYFELLVYDRQLSEGERNLVGAYLSNKWDISSMYSGGIMDVLGDVDGDQVADINDFNTILANFGQSVTNRTDGDLTNDGFVNFLDFRQWKDNRTAVSDGNVVPEPNSLLIIFSGVLGLIAFRKRLA